MSFNGGGAEGCIDGAADGCSAGGGEGFEDALGVEIHALLVGRNDELGEGGAFGGVDEVIFAGGGFADIDGVDGEVFFLKKIAEGGNAGKRWIGERTLDPELTACGNSAAQGDDLMARSAVGVALVATAA